MTTYNEMTVEQSFQATADKIRFSIYLQNINADSRAWVAVNPEDRSMGCDVEEDVTYWHELDIYTPEQYEHAMAVSEHYETYKEIHGIKPRWIAYDDLTIEEIDADISRLYKQSALQQAWHTEMEAHCAILKAEHAAYAVLWADPLPTRFESMTLAYGIAA